MHIPTHLPLLFLTLFTPLITSSPVAVSLEARDASAVKTDLSKIATDLDALTGAVKDFSGGLSAALKIQSKEQAVEKGIDKAISDTNAAKAFSESESSDITKSLLGLEPNIKSSLGALVEKKSLFTDAGVGSVVKDDLKNLKQKTGGLSTALQKKATSSDKDTIASKTKELDAAFESALGEFS